MKKLLLLGLFSLSLSVSGQLTEAVVQFITDEVISSLVLGSEYHSKTWYFANDGLDANHGHSVEMSKQSISELNGLTLDPGDIVFFNRGDRWDREYWNLTNSGDENEHIVYTSYGSGPKPIFTNSKNESSTGDWFDLGSNLWSNDDATFTAQVANMVFNDDSVGYKRIAEAFVDDTIGEFWYDHTGDSIVMYCTSNPATYYGDIECVLETDATTPRYGIVYGGSGASYLTFDDLNFKLSGGSCIWMGFNRFTDIIIRNCDFEWGGGQEAWGEQGYRLGNFFEIYGSSAENILIEKNYFRQAFDGALGPQLPDTDDSLENYFVINNLFEECRYSVALTWKVKGNSFVDSVFINNNVMYSPSGGFGAGQRWGNIDVWENAQLYLGRDPGALSSNVQIKNNIIYYDSLDLKSWKVMGAGMSAGIIFNYTPVAACYDIDNNIYYSSQTFENSHMVAGVNYVEYYSLASWQATSTTPDPNSFNSDPLFVNAPDNFKVFEASDAVGGGVTISGYTTDYEGVKVSDPPNIGAYETTQ